MSDMTSAIIEDAVKRSSLLTQLALEVNRHKGTWSHQSYNNLLLKLEREVKELKMVIHELNDMPQDCTVVQKHNQSEKMKSILSRLAGEAADISAFCTMIIYNATNRSQKS